jgi:multidrug efflux pump subunit AcrA (membrane-fusion protein)
VAVLDEATGQVERRRITIGQQNFQFAEVLSGLKEGEKLQAIKQTGARSTQQSQGTVSPRMLVPR